MPFLLQQAGVLSLMIVLSLSPCVGQDNASADTDRQLPETHPIHDDQLSTLQKLKVLPAEWLIGPYIPKENPFQPLTLRQRRAAYVRQTFGNVGAYMGRMFSAGIDQARGNHSEWGGGWEGYGLRLGSRYGQFVIKNTLHAAGNAMLGYEPRYDFCRCSGFWQRTRHAMARNFYTYNATEQEKRAAIPLYVAAFASGMLANTWFPEHRSVWKDGGYAALSQAGFGMATNWLREFSLDILQTIDKHRYPRPRN